MVNSRLSFNLKEPASWFVIAFCLVLLVPILPIMPRLQTFIHPWRPELTASLLFLTALTYLLYRNWGKILLLDISRPEINFIILPLLAFIVWSGISIAWSPSWKSALYHTLVWIEYLIFYLIARQILNKKEGFKTFLIPLTITLLIIGLPSVLEYASFLVFGGNSSIGIRYAKYGELANTIFPLVMVGVLRLAGKRFVIGLLILITLWLFIISTLGRTNLIIFLVTLVVISGLVFAFKRFHKFRRKIAFIALAMILVPLPFHLITFLSEEPSVPVVQRINEETQVHYSTDVRKLLKTISLEMFMRHPLCGIGADNFGMRFNEFRVLYAAKNPTDVNLMTIENETAERSHNEFLQILAELGAVGGAIFLWFLSCIGLMWLKALRGFRRLPLEAFAALLGLTFFLLSSIVTSYSFRLVQNGFVFFFVLAVASKILLASKPKEKARDKAAISPQAVRLSFALGILACVLLTAHCLIRVASVYYSQKAQSYSNLEQATPYYQTAFWLDDENPTAHFALAMNLLFAGRYPESTVQFQQTIEAQRATSTDFSYLATAQTLAGDSEGAEKTMAEALRLYPLSPFVRIRYAALLQNNGKLEESAKHRQIAMEINKRLALTWWLLINEGARQVTFRFAEDKNYVAVMSLTPEPAIFAVLTEREIKYPNEKFKIPGAGGGD